TIIRHQLERLRIGLLGARAVSGAHPSFSLVAAGNAVARTEPDKCVGSLQILLRRSIVPAPVSEPFPTPEISGIFGQHGAHLGHSFLNPTALCLDPGGAAAQFKRRLAVPN